MGKSKKGRGSKNKRSDPLRGVKTNGNGAANGDENGINGEDKAGQVDRISQQLQSSK